MPYIKVLSNGFKSGDMLKGVIIPRKTRISKEEINKMKAACIEEIPRINRNIKAVISQSINKSSNKVKNQNIWQNHKRKTNSKIKKNN